MLISAYFTDDFMQAFTEFSSFKAMLAEAGVTNDPGEFQTPRFERFLRNYTSFSNFSDMCLKAKSLRAEEADDERAVLE